MSRPPRTFTAAAIADARYRYEETDEPLVLIAERLGIGERTLNRYVARLKWRRRLPKPSPPPEPAHESKPDSALPVVPVVVPDVAQVAQNIQAIVQQEVAAIAAIVAKLPRSASSIEADRIARTLATLTRTLQEALRLKAPKASSEEQTDEGRGPDDPDAFILEVARRLEEFARRGEDAGDSGVAAPLSGAPR